MLNLPTSDKNIQEIDNIDDAAKQYSQEMEHNHSLITPEEEFLGHCSNIQAWYENDYDLRIIHTNLGLPMLRELVKHGDKTALISFKEQIIERIREGGYNALITFKEDLKYFNKEELKDFIDILTDDKLLMEKVLIGHLNISPKRILTDKQLETLDRTMHTLYSQVDRFLWQGTERTDRTSLSQFTNHVLERGNGRIIYGRANGSDIYLGALVTMLIDPDIELTQEDEIIGGVVIGAEVGLTDINNDINNPYPDNQHLQIYTAPLFGDQAWCYVNGGYHLLPLDRVIGHTLRDVQLNVANGVLTLT